MRSLSLIFAASILAIACDDGAVSSDTADTSAPDTSAPETVPDTTVPEDIAVIPAELDPPAQGFQIKTPPITVPAATEQTWCYYFSVPVDEAVGVKRWESLMTAGSHHLIVYFTAEPNEPDGTVTEDCDGFGGGFTNIPVWTYSSQTRQGQMRMPEGVGMKVGARQYGYIQMHYLNPTLEPLEVHVTVNGETFAAGETYQQAAAFVTFHTGIQIPAGIGQSASAQGKCRVKEGIHFFALSTHAHRRAVATEVKDGDAVLFASDNWEHPGAVRWDEGYTFTGDLAYRCDYVNDLDDAVTTGNSAQTDEMCMAVGYFYPAQRPIFCIGSLVVSQ